jgi:cysteinyl-tRNA synthetase
MDALGVKRADLYPRVSQEIPAIIEMIEKLVEKGNAYVVDGDVYFDVTSFPDYGKLSGQQLEELESRRPPSCR